MKKLILCGMMLLTIALMASCSSDTVDGNPNYFTSGMLSTTLDDGTAMFFLDNGDGTVSVTYDRTNPTHLNSSNSANITTYTGVVNVPEQVTIDGKNYVVTGVDEGAFANCQSITKVMLPATVKVLGEGAFVNCRAMTEVNIPAGVTEIPSAAFGYCNKVKTFVLPEGVTSIGVAAFANATAMTSITIPEGVTRIGRTAFTRCTGIKEMTLPSTVKSIGGNCFLTASKLTKLHVKATTPPALEDSLTDNKNMVLYVPTGCKTAYEQVELWTKFKSIEEE